VQQASYYYGQGYYSPTNIVRAKDGYYHAFVMAIPSPSYVGMPGFCPIRTDRLEDPASWRAWDGSGYNLRMTSPYVTGTSAPVCVFPQYTPFMWHLVYNTYLERYMAVTNVSTRNPSGEGRTCGIFFSLSADLIHWSRLQLLVPAKINNCEFDQQGPGLLEPVLVSYPSIVDHADASINFENAGATAHLYYTRFNDGGFDRDLVRVPITFTRVD
jgi:hypothetical protein